MDNAHVSAGVLLIALITGCDVERQRPVDANVVASEVSWSDQLSEVRAGTQTELHTLHSVVTDDDWQQLAAGCESLEVLDVETLQIGSNGFPLLRGLPRLRHLRIGSVVSDVELRDITAVASLRVLNLPQGEFTDDGIQQLASLPHLELLRFRSPHVTDQGMQFIASLPSLRYLHLIEVPITDNGLAHLAGCEDLKSLYLDGCGCTDDGIRRLLESLPRLHLHMDQLHLEDDPHAHPH